MGIKTRLSFYNKHGDRVDDLQLIQRTYLTTWHQFPLDALTACPLEALAFVFPEGGRALLLVCVKVISRIDNYMIPSPGKHIY